MRNIKGYFLVVLVAIIMILGISSNITIAYAEVILYKNELKAKTLYEMGLYKQISLDDYAPYLGRFSREQGITSIVRLFGKAADAADLTDGQVDVALEKFVDKANVEPIYKNAIAYAVLNGIVKGDGLNLSPKEPMLGKDACTLIIRGLGYSDNEYSYDSACEFFANKNGNSSTDVRLLNDKELLIDDLIGFEYDSLNMKAKDGYKLIQKLIKDTPSLKEKAIKYGIIKED